MKLIVLIAEWRARLSRIRTLEDDPSTAWLWGIRARILEFLISRYASEASEPVRIEQRVVHEPASFCSVVSADGPPPRSSAEAARLLDDIRWCNRREPWWRPCFGRPRQRP